MADEPKRLYCPVHWQWFEPGVTVCPIGDCATKLVENWNIRTTGMQVAPPVEMSTTAEPPEDKSRTRKPIWAGDDYEAN